MADETGEAGAKGESGETGETGATGEAPGGPAAEPARLVSAVLDEEARRQADAASLDAHDDGDVDVAGLPGVGGDAPPTREVLDRSGRALLLTVGAMWGLGFAVFAVAAALALKISHQYDFSFRFLVQVVVLPGFTIVAVSQPLGNLVDRPRTNRPVVMRWLLGVS
ncbi:MAG TPA: hypothetical protein VEP49_16640, partial [Acidimicrobiia bacterium]|nr:hypothetical protein [Acidimicrobiia bacterium]